MINFAWKRESRRQRERRATASLSQHRRVFCCSDRIGSRHMLLYTILTSKSKGNSTMYIHSSYLSLLLAYRYFILGTLFICDIMVVSIIKRSRTLCLSVSLLTRHFPPTFHQLSTNFPLTFHQLSTTFLNGSSTRACIALKIS